MKKSWLEYCDGLTYTVNEYYCDNCGDEIGGEEAIIHCGQVWCKECGQKLLDFKIVDGARLEEYDNELND